MSVPRPPPTATSKAEQGKGGRTHLVSPQVAAATAVLGHLASPADLSEAPANAGV